MPIAPAPERATAETRALVRRRAAEWREHHVRWRWLLDSLEGGDRYRHAVYGVDARRMPVMNLTRHKREYPDPRTAADGASAYYNGTASAAAGFDAAADGLSGYEPPTDDDFALRLARTPVPTFVAEAISDHLDRVYAREVDRDVPEALAAWAADVDGLGTPIDAWMHRTVAPLLLACGQLDVLMDHPAAPEGEDVRTRADELRLGLGRCVASYVLPENMLWWRLLPNGRYRECLVREFPDADAETRKPAYRHWTAGASRLYDGDGAPLGPPVPHKFGRVPIERLFAARKPRCTHVGQSPYEATAERQREAYNVSSELILSNTTQAHPLLQGPEDYVQPDGTVPIGPNWLLPKKKNSNGGPATYEGFDVVNFPKDGAESLRESVRELRDETDRDTAMAKPAGSSASGGKGAGVVAQSGESKGYDHDRLDNKLSGIADALQAAELGLARLALAVLTDGGASDAEMAAVAISYSKQFDLADPAEMAADFQALLGILGSQPARDVPKLAGEVACWLARRILPGRDDAAYAAWDAEIASALAKPIEPPPMAPGAPGPKPPAAPKPAGTPAPKD